MKEVLQGEVMCGRTKGTCCCGESKEHCYKGTEIIVVVARGVREHSFVVEYCCGRSWAARGME